MRIFDLDQSLSVPSLFETEYALVAMPLDSLGLMRRARMEVFAFLLLTAVIMPALAVATVGGYGLVVWVYQMMTGPPGPPQP